MPIIQTEYITSLTCSDEVVSRTALPREILAHVDSPSPVHSGASIEVAVAVAAAAVVAVGTLVSSRSALVNFGISRC